MRVGNETVVFLSIGFQTMRIDVCEREVGDRFSLSLFLACYWLAHLFNP